MVARESEATAPIRGDVGETAAELVEATPHAATAMRRKREREGSGGWCRKWMEER